MDLEEVYKAVLDMLDRERSSSKLNEIDENLFNKVLNFIKSTKIDEFKDDIEKIRIYIKIKETFSEFVFKRVEKMVLYALYASRDKEYIEPKNLMSSEREFYSQILKKIKEKLLEIEKSNDNGKITVRLLQDLPEIVGIDGKIYGPFKKEDVVNLPKENAEALIKRGVAEKIDVLR